MVETECLAAHLDAPDVRVIHATSFLPTVDYDPEGEFNFARFFGITDTVDSVNPLPHMLPRAAQFSSKIRTLGLGDGSRIVAHHSSGGTSESCWA